MEHRRNVVVILKVLKEKIHLLQILFTLKCNVILRDHIKLSADHGITLFLKSLAYRSQVILFCVDLKAFVLGNKVCRTCLPLAIAYLLLTDRERDYNAQQMKSRFYSALKEAAKGREMAVADCYGGEVL